MTEYSLEQDENQSTKNVSNNNNSSSNHHHHLIKEGTIITKRMPSKHTGNSEDSKNVLIKEMSVGKLKERLEELKSSFIDEIEGKMSEIVASLLHEVQNSELLIDEQQALFENDKYENRDKPKNDGKLPDKKFMARNSLLTDLFQIKHIRTIYHIFIAILIILFLNSILYDLVDSGRLSLGFELIFWCFGEFRTVVMIWLCMKSSTLFVYLCFYMYSTQRVKLSPKSQKSWDYVWLGIYILYQFLFLCLPTQSLLHHNLPPASSLIVLMEQVRLLMKSHAFVRSNVPRARNYKLKDEDFDENAPCPGFSQFLYFLFVPTLVYRDSYPRTSSIRWNEVAWSFLEVIGVIFYTSFIFQRLIIPEVRKFGERELDAKALILLVFGCMMPSTLVLLCGFFCLLHSWMNAFAEMTCFADRMFYKDWWNCTSFGVYFRTWNVVVHDWLYTYIYKDFSEHVTPKSRVIPKLTVFAVSALFHEYILTLAFRFFYPVMLLMFGGFGVALSFVRRKDHAGGNVFMWLSLSCGTGLFLSLFCMEYYARINCPNIYPDSMLDFVIPRTWTCQTL